MLSQLIHFVAIGSYNFFVLCQVGYFGHDCSNYILVYYTEVDAWNAKVHLEWNLKEFHTGTNVIERTVNPDGSGVCSNCPVLAVIDRQQGSSTADLNFGSGFGGRPWGEQCHSARLSLGTNEFGASRGYVTNHIPCLKLGSGVTRNTELNGSSGRCVCGGTPPPAGTIGATLTCPSSSYTTDCCPESEANCRGRTGRTN